MRYKGLILLGFFATITSLMDNENKQISARATKLFDELMEEVVIFDDELEKEKFFNVVNRLSDRDNIVRVLKKIPELFFDTNDQSVKTTMHENIENSYAIELGEDEVGVIDGCIAKVEVDDLKELNMKINEIEAAINKLNRFADNEENKDQKLAMMTNNVDNYLDDQNDKIKINTSIDDEVINRVYQEVLNEQNHNDLDEHINVYLDSLVDQFKELDSNQDQKIINKISSYYNNLSDEFIKDYYQLKDILASEYQIGDDVMILHRLIFKDINQLRHFVDIVVDHGYLVNVDEVKGLVDVFRRIKVVDGKILSEIFDIANQAAYLAGRYEGYLID